MSAQNDVIACGNHATLAFDKMKSLREKSALCDITLKLKDTEIPAHKVVLAASSPYFEFMFTGNVKERTKECIEISDFSPEAFLTVVNFMYSGYLVMNEETMLDVLEVADFLKISNAKEKCFKYVEEHIKISNCLQIRDIAKKYYFTELEVKVKKFIENNFIEFTKSDGFFRLSFDEVKGLITEQSCYTDDSLYEKAVSNWVEYETDSRKGLKDDLVGVLNAHILNLEQKELNVYNALSSKRIYVMHRDTSSDDVFFRDLNNSSWNCVSSRPKFETIDPIFHNNSVYVICNEKCGRLNMALEEWELNMIPSNNYTAGCSVPNGIYLIGKSPSKETFIYNTETNGLLPQRQLIRRRSRPGVAYSENCLYVCGGGCNLAERRDLRTSVWRSISCLPTDTDELSATSLHDKVYVTSTSSGKFSEFDKRKGVWIVKTEIPKADKSSFVLGSTDESIYSHNGKEIFRYDMKRDEWNYVANGSNSNSFVCVYSH